ncbi:hypothetical protein AURDEDRAFT_167946 [Auricularia subglabra TFB-10046 SS5]|nr:hypothetical protein AURDEDRAFT_167946 [Auricularia subglabra TFB-10046 SS5]
MSTNQTPANTGAPGQGEGPYSIAYLLKVAVELAPVPLRDAYSDKVGMRVRLMIKVYARQHLEWQLLYYLQKLKHALTKNLRAAKRRKLHAERASDKKHVGNVTKRA